MEGPEMARVPASFLQGQCLIAAPAQAGTYFEEALILITHHEDGALGVILNRPRSGVSIRNYLPSADREIAGVGIWSGGPVEENLMSIVGFLYRQRRLTVRSHLTPKEAVGFGREYYPDGVLRAYLGYAGWAPGQLEAEIARGDWRLTPFTPALLHIETGS